MNETLEKLYRDAKDLHNRGNFADAGRLYQRILARNPAHADSLHMLGVLALQTGQTKIAVDFLRQSIAIDDDVPSYHNNLGNALQLLGQLSDAEVSYLRALRREPNNPDILTNLATALQEMGRHTDAIYNYEKALTWRPDSTEILLGLATALHFDGDCTRAIECYQQVLKLDSSIAVAHNGLGYAFQALGHLEQAIDCYSKAIALNQKYVEALFNLAVVYQELKKLETAKKYYQQVLKFSPNHAAAHNNLGYLEFCRGNLTSAIEKYRLSLQLDEHDADTHNNLGFALQKSGQLSEARRSFEQAIREDPEHAEAHNNLGNVFKDLGEFPGALSQYSRAIEVKPDYALPHFNRADLKRFQPNDPDLVSLTALESKVQGRTSDSAEFVHFALAKALDDIGDFDGAFAQMSKGNRIARSKIRYDENTLCTYLERIKATFHHKLFSRFRGVGDASRNPIFIVGMPRSGTTLVEQILASHAQVRAMGESTAFEQSMRAHPGLRNYPECMPTVRPDVLMQLADKYINAVPVAMTDETHFTDKLPGNFVNLGLIVLAFPNARIIHVVRDPMDNILSCYSKLFRNYTQEFSYDLTELARYYAGYRVMMEHWYEVLPEHNVLELSYEYVIDDFDGQIRRMLKFCGLMWDDKCARFHETRRVVDTASAAQVRRPLYRSSIQRWRNYRTHLEVVAEEVRPWINGMRQE